MQLEHQFLSPATWQPAASTSGLSVLDRPRRVNAEAELRHAGVVLHNEPLVSPDDTEAAEPEFPRRRDMPPWRRATVVWLRPDVTRPDLAYLPFEHVNTDWIYATTVTEVIARHKAFVRKWRLKWSRCRRQSGGGRSAALHLPALSARKWKSLRTKMPSSVCTRSSSGAFKTQCLLPCAETACMLF